jgi:hypothetical protein
MTINSSRTAQRILESFTNEPDATQTIIQLLEELENKNDPDPIEIRLVQNLYHFLEKLKILEHNLSSYVKDNNKNLLGTKLDSLYEKQESFGTSRLF